MSRTNAKDNTFKPYKWCLTTSSTKCYPLLVTVHSTSFRISIRNKNFNKVWFSSESPKEVCLMNDDSHEMKKKCTWNSHCAKENWSNFSFLYLLVSWEVNLRTSKFHHFQRKKKGLKAISLNHEYRKNYI